MRNTANRPQILLISEAGGEHPTPKKKKKKRKKKKGSISRYHNQADTSTRAGKNPLIKRKKTAFTSVLYGQVQGIQNRGGAGGENETKQRESQVFAKTRGNGSIQESKKKLNLRPNPIRRSHKRPAELSETAESPCPKKRILPKKGKKLKRRKIGLPNLGMRLMKRLVGQRRCGEYQAVLLKRIAEKKVRRS